MDDEILHSWDEFQSNLCTKDSFVPCLVGQGNISEELLVPCLGSV